MQILTFNGIKYDNFLFRRCLHLIQPRTWNQIRTICHIRPLPETINYKAMLASLKLQDEAKGRDFNLTVPYIQLLEKKHIFIMKKLICPHCKVELSTDRNSQNGYSCNRINNELGHLINNIYLCCKRCNCYTKRCEKVKKLIDISHYQDQENWMETIMETFGSDQISCIKEVKKLKTLFCAMFRFQDVRSFISPCNLKNYLSSWGIPEAEGKGIFPYQTLMGTGTQEELLKDLDRTDWYAKEEFSNWLKSEEISDKDYNYLKNEIWIGKKMKTRKEFLSWYQLLDVLPFAKAVQKHKMFYFKNHGVDLFKNYCSLPAFAIWSAMQSAMTCTSLKKKVFSVVAEPWLYKAFRDAMVGGYSNCLKNRYHEVGKTFINNKPFHHFTCWDANCLYLFCASGWLPCGDYKILYIENDTEKVLKDIKSGAFFGFLKCSLRCTAKGEKMYRRIGFAPIFKKTTFHLNPETAESVVGPTMMKLRERFPKKITDEFGNVTYQKKVFMKTTKLVNSLWAKDILISSSLAKWYMDHEVEIYDVTYLVAYTKMKPLKTFHDDIIRARVLGDIKDKDGKKPFHNLAQTAKRTGNGFTGRLGMDVSKFTKSVLCNGEQLKLLRSAIDYKSCEKIGDDWYQATRLKRQIEWKTPNHLYCWIYMEAKKVLLEFVYDFLDKVLDPTSWESNGTDTDCFCASFNDTWENCIRDKPLYEKLKKKFFCSNDTEKVAMTLQHEGKSYDISQAAYEHRVGGKFKMESEGDFVAWITAKMALLGLLKANHKDKFGELGLKISFKGGNNLNYGLVKNWIVQSMKNDFVGIILGQQATIRSHNKGFRVRDEDQRLITYYQDKSCASFWHDKSIIEPDCMHTSITPL